MGIADAKIIVDVQCDGLTVTYELVKMPNVVSSLGSMPFPLSLRIVGGLSKHTDYYAQKVAPSTVWLNLNQPHTQTYAYYGEMVASLDALKDVLRFYNQEHSKFHEA